MNEGLDLGCAVGEEVFAVAEGHSIVEAVGKLEGPGLQEVGRVPDEVQVEERLEEYTVAGMRHFEVDMGDMSPEEGEEGEIGEGLGATVKTVGVWGHAISTWGVRMPLKAPPQLMYSSSW